MWCQFIGELIAFAALFAMYRADSKKILDGYTPVVTSAPIILLTCAFAFGVWAIITGLSIIVEAFNLFPSYKKIEMALTQGTFISQFFTAVIGAPIVEELCFRGILMKRMLYWMPKWVAVLISSALFGLVHLNVFQSLYTFALGVLLGLLYARYRSLIIPIIAHIVFNLTSVLTSQIPVTNYEPTTIDIVTSVANNFVFGMVIFLLAGNALLKHPKSELARMLEEEQPADHREIDTKIIDVPLE
jgi:membrane protease YdiL (CAAX protease family)